MSETFSFDVSYSTTFEDLENLRDRMLAFVKAERRDFLPEFDVKVKDFPEQGSMVLTADIKYKNNFQQGALKAKRRNKWICALKTILGDLKIYGPKGNPSPPPGVTRYAKVPWEIIEREDQKKDFEASQTTSDRPPTVGWNLSDKNAPILDDGNDVFGDADQLHMPHPQRGISSSSDIPSTRTAVTPQATTAPRQAFPPDAYEMQPRR